MRRVSASVLALSLAALGLPLAAHAASIDDFIRKDRFQDVKVSPKGTYFAATVPVDDKTVLVVLKPGETKPIAHFNLRGKTHVMDFHWANDERLLFTVGEKDGALEQPVPQGEIWGMNADGSQTRVLVGWKNTDRTSGRAGGKSVLEPVAATLVDTLEKDDDKAIIAVYRFGTPYTSAERLDVTSGARTPVAQAPIERATFVTDQSGEVRFAIGAKSDNVSKLYYRSGAGAEWQLLNDEGKTGVIVAPLGFSADNSKAYLERENAKGPNSVIEMTVATQAMREVARHDAFDPAGLAYAIGTDHPIGIRFDDPKPRFQYFDAASPEARLHASLQGSFGGDVAVPASRTTTKGEVLVFTYSDRNPGDYFAFDVGKTRANHVISRRDWIKPERMATTRAVEFTARDGRKLHGLLTAPSVPAGRALPMIVNPHGGPFGIVDTWGFESERQMLAANGYAVLQVNFRGSGGFGREHRMAGFKQWGRTMQDDLTDATRAMIQQGVADPARICIYGASYGGYAALMGVAKDPSLYRCAAGYVGVYDLPKMHQTGDVPQQLSGVNFLKDALGTEGLEETSPNRIADRIKVPVFLAAGGEDKRAPIEHTELMERALRNAGVPVETLYYPTEGHGFYRVEHQREFYTRLLAFFARHIGAGGAPAGAAAGAP